MAIRARIQAIAGVILVGSCILVKAQMYPFGALMGDTSVNLKGDAQTCIDFRNVRIVNPIVSGTTSLTDLVTPNGKLCMSPNGGITFDETVFGSTFTPLPEAPAAHNTAILPLHMDYSTDSHSTDTTAGEFGLFYKVIPCGVDLDAYVTDLANCGLNVAGFNAFWGIKVTWGHLMTPSNIVYWSTTPSPSNTFQVVLLGNALESTYAIINYGRLDVTDYSAAQRIIQGVGSNTQPLDPLGNNCGAGTGRYVFYLSDDQVLAPGGAPVCDAALNCGRYGLTGASLPTVSGTCDAMGECICSAGYSGLYCLNDDACDCNPNPCDAANTILCEDTGMVDPAFKCHCNFGFTGATCDTAILACDSSPCEHGGTCTDIPYDFMCTCPSNWQGITCQTDVDECAAVVNPCLNGGTCTNTDGGFTCTCADGYTGDTFPPKSLVISLRRPSTSTLFRIEGEPTVWVEKLRSGASDQISVDTIDFELSEFDARSLSADAAHHRVFMTDVGSGSSGRIVVQDLREDFASVHSSRLSKDDNLIAVDWINQNIYWIDKDDQASHLAVSSLVTTKDAILRTGLSSPVALAVAPAQRYLFWIETGSQRAIRRSNLDGSDVNSIVTTNLVHPVAMTIDHNLQRMLWVDDTRRMVESTDFDGSNRSTVWEEPSFLPQGYTHLDIYHEFGFLLRRDENKVDVINNGNGSYIATYDIAIEGETDATSHGLTMYAADRQSPSSGPCGCNNGACDQICMPTPTGTVTCLCGFGWELQGDGRTCSSTLVEDVFLLTMDSSTNEIYQIDLTSGAIRVLAVQLLSQPIVLLYNPIRKVVYWPNVEDHQIRMASWDGSVSEVLLELPENSVVDGMALDLNTNRVYFTDTGTKQVGYFAHSSIINVVSTGESSEPRDIQLDLVQRVMYWTDRGSEARIERANMDDGSERRTIVSSDLKWPNGLAIDFTKGLLYWCDGYTSRIERANLDGSGRTLLLRDSVINSQFHGLTLDETYLYYTDWRRRYVQRMDKQSLATEKLGPAFYGHLSDIHLFNSTFVNYGVPWKPSTTRQPTTTSQPATTPQPEGQGLPLTTIIAVVVGGAVLITLIVTVTVCCVRKTGRPAIQETTDTALPAENTGIDIPMTDHYLSTINVPIYDEIHDDNLRQAHPAPRLPGTQPMPPYSHMAAPTVPTDPPESSNLHGRA